MIDGAIVKPLKVIADDRGLVMEMMRDDDAFFRKFGQVYLSVVYPGVVKGWHYHKKQTDHFVIVKGMAKVVLYDRREDSKTHGEINEFFMGEQNPMLLVIPPLVLHGMKGIGVEPAYLVNTPTEHYVHASPDEFRVPPHDPSIPYDWSRKDG
ncbi:MAG TPA: dTDP-4-dehydrorhamnose 3,5-epimerase family protein [Candidatus Eisenbacteria bacterium]|nr:dTDP-4-dehydrorhamnose 3,5-epimerase family protein [Candidatus Eisenbacteria bacterium]